MAEKKIKKPIKMLKYRLPCDLYCLYADHYIKKAFPQKQSCSRILFPPSLVHSPFLTVPSSLKAYSDTAVSYKSVHYSKINWKFSGVLKIAFTKLGNSSKISRQIG